MCAGWPRAAEAASLVGYGIVLPGALGFALGIEGLFIALRALVQQAQPAE